MSEEHAPREDWLAAAWQSLPDRCDTIVMRRLAGDTLESIANGLTLRARESGSFRRRLKSPSLTRNAARRPASPT